MSEKLLTSEYGYEAAKIFITAMSLDNYYLFAAKSSPYSNTDSVIETPENTDNYKLMVYRDMLFGKRITNNDVSMVITRNDWTSNTVFVQYDDRDTELYNEKFYAIVNAGAQYHLYKCLYNNGNSVSTVQPDFSAVSLDDEYYQTSDGYIWKYIYSVDSATEAKFSTTKYFPLGVNNTVVNNAVSGAIDIISIVNGGYNYNNYLAGNNSFVQTQLRIGGNDLAYDISGNSYASSVNNYYNGCYIYIKSGPALEVGQYKKIVQYFANSTAKVIILDSKFDVPLTIASSFDIYPGVHVIGDGRETANAFGRAIINAVSNSVSSIEMLEFGANYFVGTANVDVYSGVGANNAVLRPIFSPPGGHGSNPALEFDATSVMISVQFSNTENGTILSSNDYRTLGVLRKPLYSNVNVVTSEISTTFIVEEEIRKATPILLGTNGSLSSTSNVYTNDTVDLSKQFTSGDGVLFFDGNTYSYATISSVTNSSSIILASNSTLTSNTIEHYLPNFSVTANVYSSNSTSVVLNNVDGTIKSNDLLIGMTSGTYAIANTIYISNTAKGFDTFINTYKYSTTLISGTFQEDEIVYQDTLTNANAIFHSIVNNSIIYTSNNIGSFKTNDTIIGSNSGAIAYVNEIYIPELVTRSGEILYIENVNPIDRTDTQTEKFKLVFKY